jgi:hypothetical protein
MIFETDPYEYKGSAMDGILPRTSLLANGKAAKVAKNDLRFMLRPL